MSESLWKLHARDSEILITFLRKPFDSFESETVGSQDFLFALLYNFIDLVGTWDIGNS